MPTQRSQTLATYVDALRRVLREHAVSTETSVLEVELREETLSEAEIDLLR